MAQYRMSAPPIAQRVKWGIRTSHLGYGPPDTHDQYATESKPFDPWMINIASSSLEVRLWEAAYELLYYQVS